MRVCTRNASTQSEPWRMDFATPCGVTMTFTRGTRYCTFDDVKTGNAEVLASCHRLRTHDVAMRPSKAKGAVELNDMIAFLVQGSDGKQSMTILVDSPARVTDDGTVVVIGRDAETACARLRNDSPQRCCRSPRQQRSGRRLRSRRRRTSVITAVDGVDGGTRTRRGDRLSRFAGR